MSPFRHIVISRNAPSRKALWLKPDEWTVYGHTAQGWRPLQASLFESVNSKMDKADKAVLDYVVNALKGKQDALTPGDGISISKDNVISATAAEADLSDYYTKEETDKAIGEATESLATEDELEEGLSGKQDTLTPGSGISIVGNVISSTAGGPEVDSVEITAAEVDALWDATE